MYGVMRAVAADFTGRGRKDIVAVSFLPPEHFPRREEQRLDAVVLLEQTEPGKYVRHSLGAGECDHFTCAAGDLNGDGTVDLVTGSFRLSEGGKLDRAVTVWKNCGRRE
ncbi:MAG TPA: VCBS repeat-containing protein, partial [Gemmataceae bacterium]|nr:VCBS repeat-containing protein [Gemmataceae bacterium]